MTAPVPKFKWLGSKARLYRNTGTYDSPTWSAYGSRTKIGLKLGVVTANVTAQDSDGFDDEQAVLKTIGLEVEAYATDPPEDDEHYQAVVAAWEGILDGDTIEFAIAYGDITEAGVKYRRITVQVSLDEDIGEKDPFKYKVSCMKAPGVSPTSHTVSS